MSRRRNLVSGWALALAAMVLFAGLGSWQLDRRAQKQATVDAAQRVLRERVAQPLQAASDAGQAREYAWAAGEGRFVDAPAVLLDNQQRQGRAGVRVYRLFQPADGATPLLAELGWMPLQGDRRMPQVPRPQGSLHVQGLLAPPPSPGLVDAVAAPQADGTLLVTAIDVDQLRGMLAAQRIGARVLRLDPKTPLGYARDLDVLPNTLPPEKHLGYAVQWFALALAVLATALLLTFRKAKP